MDMFKQGDKFPISAEYSEFVSLATDGVFVPEEGSTAEITGVVTGKSGQTLFRVKVSAVVDDPNNFDEDSGGKVVSVRTFPATVSLLQKMAKLKKKADKEAGVVAPVKENPNKKVDGAASHKIEVLGVGGDDDDYDPFKQSMDDF